MVSGLGQRQLPWVLSEAVTQRTLVEYSHILHKFAATINFKVMKNGKAVAGEMVYLYRADLGESFLANKIHADKKAATDDQGVAEFKLASLDFAAVTTLSYIVETFDSKEVVNGKTAVSVNKGQTKDVTLTQR